MEIELWSKPTKLGPYGDDRMAIHLRVKDGLGLNGDLKFQNLLRLQVCSFVAVPKHVQIIIDHEGIQFLVDRKVYDDLAPRFSSIVKNFIRDYLEQRQKGTTHGL